MSANFVEVNCPVCSSNLRKILYTNIFHNCNVLKLTKVEDHSSNIYQCSDCSHVYLSPILSKQVLEEYYNLINSEYYKESNEPLDSRKNENLFYADNISNLLKGNEKAKILEIGCGYGFLLKKLNELGYDTYGVEPSPLASDFAKNNLGLKVSNAFLSENLFANNSFDCIILMDVVEHIPNPNELFSLINKLLKPSGYIYFLTGNVDSCYAKWAKSKWWYFSSWEHISFFNPKSTKIILEKNNFELFQIAKTANSIDFWINIRCIITSFMKRLINLFVNKYDYYGICFDHIIVIGKKL